MTGGTRSALTDEFWRAYRDAAGLDHDNYDVVAFGDGAEMATDLAELTVAGIKRATAGLVRQFGPDGEAPPVVGGVVVLLLLTGTVIAAWLAGAGGSGDRPQPAPAPLAVTRWPREGTPGARN